MNEIVLLGCVIASGWSVLETEAVAKDAALTTFTFFAVAGTQGTERASVGAARATGGKCTATTAGRDVRVGGAADMLPPLPVPVATGRRARAGAVLVVAEPSSDGARDGASGIVASSTNPGREGSDRDGSGCDIISSD